MHTDITTYTDGEGSLTFQVIVRTPEGFRRRIDVHADSASRACQRVEADGHIVFSVIRWLR